MSKDIKSISSQFINSNAKTSWPSWGYPRHPTSRKVKLAETPECVDMPISVCLLNWSRCCPFCRARAAFLMAKTAFSWRKEKHFKMILRPYCFDFITSLDFTRVIYVCWQNMICTWLALIITNTCSSPKSAVKGQHPPSWEVPHFSVEFHPPNVFVPETHWKTMMGVRKLDLKADQSLISLIRKPFLLCHGTRPSVGLNLNDDISCDSSLLKLHSVFW